ncbi:MAG: DUF167 domain-containing protein [Vampirovibrionales bacterium]|nr:DUF167 domain-containing protein [Vampirovibrionales bacterium]
MAMFIHEEPLTLRVWAKPGAGKTAVLGWRVGADNTAQLVVAVAAPPEDGKANVAIGECMAQWLGLPKRWAIHWCRVLHIVKSNGPSTYLHVFPRATGHPPGEDNPGL